VLQLAVKISPEAYDYDESAWVPIVYKVDKIVDKAAPTSPSAVGTSEEKKL
jgi:hypothetical protein